jgi:signal transduction histidine kinase
MSATYNTDCNVLKLDDTSDLESVIHPLKVQLVSALGLAQVLLSTRPDGEQEDWLDTLYQEGDVLLKSLEELLLSLDQLDPSKESTEHLG